MGHAHLHHQKRQKRDFVRRAADPINGFGKLPVHDSGKVIPRAETYIRTVYKTLSPTFTGEIGGYSTRGQDDAKPTPNNQPQAAPTPGPAAQTDVPGLIIAPALPNDSTNDSTATLSLPTSTARPGSSNSKDAAAQSASTTVKAGIAFGVLGGVLLVGMLVFFIFNRRKKHIQRKRQRQKLVQDNEKISHPNNLARAPTYRQDGQPPRVSLRPVTQFLPTLDMDPNVSGGPPMMAKAPSIANSVTTNHRQPVEPPCDPTRPSTSHSNNPNNPFGTNAEHINAPNSVPHDPWTANGPVVSAAAAAAGAGAGATATLARKMPAARKDMQRDVDLTLPATLGTPIPNSPAITEFSMSYMPVGASHPPSNGAAAIAAAGGPASSTVHRVQLDFKPTLEDEMELTAGDLVRLLHEYDDGWALCIRLDRSQQGVVPRTCLSVRPVKPRTPQGASRLGPPIKAPHSAFSRGPAQDSPLTTPHDEQMSSRSGPLGEPFMSPKKIKPRPKISLSPKISQRPPGKNLGQRPIPGQAY